MGREQFANSVATTLNGTINSSVTTVVVTDGSTFPAGFFRVTIGSEIMLCTARSSNTLTVLRGQEGTTAAGHSSGVEVNHLITAGAFKQHRNDILADLGYIDYNPSLSADDDDFDDDSFDAAWSVVQGTPNMSLIEKNHRCSVVIPPGTNAAQHYGLMKPKTISAGFWVQAGFQMAGNGGGYPICGVGFANGNTYNSGKQVQWGFSIAERALFIRGLNGYNVQAGSEVGQGNMTAYLWPVCHLRFTYLSTNTYKAEASVDCVNWTTIYASQGVHDMGDPTYAGLIFTNWALNRYFQHSFLYCRFSS